MANTEALARVLKHLQENPDQYDAIRWHQDFAGWTLRLLADAEVKRDGCDIETLYDASGERIWIADIGPYAQRILGLSAGMAARLFSGTNTLDDLATIVAEICANSEVAA